MFVICAFLLTRTGDGGARPPSAEEMDCILNPQACELPVKGFRMVSQNHRLPRWGSHTKTELYSRLTMHPVNTQLDRLGLKDAEGEVV